ncbi:MULTISPECIES: hypothetical protein [Haloferax]|uniref:Uncharacterized protein n=2 Tax=Haloferax TaxID=2251 RepID=A0A6G1Z787_9EURY|nr:MULTISPECIES: hypothetical protein [Haloferax]KAB1184784.1 hypothetical protein Hfx1149_17115 [Haloferax sp. CBA1149]MRW82416.1 hypothetical protein [Haloferax marinisediminis]
MTDIHEEDFRAAFDMLSPEAKSALVEAILDNPTAVESFALNANQDNGESVKMVHEVDYDIPDLEDRLDGLPRTTREFYEVVKEVPEPLSREDIAAFIQKEHQDFLEDHASAKYNSWLSKHLNKLSKAGVLGKYRHNRKVFYTPDIERAIYDWYSINQPEEELGPKLANEIASETGMPWAVVRATLERVT